MLPFDDLQRHLQTRILLRIPSLLPPGLAGLERVLKMTSLLQERGQGGLPDSELARRALHQTPHRHPLAHLTRLP